MEKQITVWGIEEETSLPYHEPEIFIHNTLYQDKGAARREMDRLDKEANDVDKYFSLREFTVVLGRENENAADSNE